MGEMPRRILINPFIFPSELKFYFVVMLIIVIAPALSLSFSISIFLLQPTFPLEFYFYSLIAIPFFSFILLPTLTFMLYTRDVKNKLQYCRNKVEDAYPRVSKLIEDVCNKMKIQTPVSFYVEDQGLNAIVFGFRRKQFLLVSNGLCKKSETFPKLVETVVIHELSHIKNEDIFLHEVAESLWKAFAVVCLLSSIYCIVIYREVFAWLFIVFIIYIFPLLVVFYLNNVIQKWREVYADMRTIAFQGTDVHVLTFLRIVFPTSKSNLFRKMLSPFTLTNVKRIQVIQEGPFKNIVERGFISSCMSVLTLFSSFLFIIFSGIVETPELPIILMLTWSLLCFALFSVMALPYWACKSLKIESTSTTIIQIFTVPLKVALVVAIPIILIMPINLFLEMQVYFFLVIYIFLLAHFILFRFILSLTLVKVEAKNKILFSELILALLPVQMMIAFLGISELTYGFTALVVVLVVILFIATVKYSKCPYCGKDFKQFSPFECPHCLNKLNEDFLINLS